MRCGKCKQQWHATPPLITLPVSEIPVAVVDEVADVTPAPETVAPDITESASEVAAETLPETPKGFNQYLTADEPVEALPPLNGALQKVATRNAIIAAVVLAALLSVPVFMATHLAVKAEEKTSPAVAHETPAEKHAEKHAEKIPEKHAQKKEGHDIVLDGTPTTLLKEELGQTILSIEGALINKTPTIQTVPTLQAQALNAKGKVVKEWIIPITNKQMDPGQRQSFSFSMPFAEQGVVDIAFHFLHKE